MKARDNQSWVYDLSSVGQERENALADLHEILLKQLPRALTRWLPADNPALLPLVEDVAQETMLRVLDKLHTFQGLSQFTTWVYKIAVRIALTELRRERWKETSLDEMTDEGSPDPQSWYLESREQGPETAAEQEDALEHLKRILSEELTEKQRQALMAYGIHGMPLEEVARRLGTNRNALYKLMHDARLRLKTRMKNEGLPIESLLELFSR